MSNDGTKTKQSQYVMFNQTNDAGFVDWKI